MAIRHQDVKIWQDMKILAQAVGEHKGHGLRLTLINAGGDVFLGKNAASREEMLFSIMNAMNGNKFESMQKMMIEVSLQKFKTQAHAANWLGISKRAFNYWVHKLGLPRPGGKGGRKPRSLEKENRSWGVPERATME